MPRAPAGILPRRPLREDPAVQPRPLAGLDHRPRTRASRPGTGSWSKRDLKSRVPLRPRCLDSPGRRQRGIAEFVVRRSREATDQRVGTDIARCSADQVDGVGEHGGLPTVSAVIVTDAPDARPRRARQVHRRLGRPGCSVERSTNTRGRARSAAHRCWRRSTGRRCPAGRQPESVQRRRLSRARAGPKFTAVLMSR